ncbi:hypothetical protein THMIRHAS_06630 [Thiosulfatimonas sediminis]|uniref:SPOR domain-containing protein n=2 Tax=Thiosulfatimonas sediminis TaxID=2675054 RepID=A0A6F8PTI1_9GAMM|nr:hypothetical protein THMIRHAS_06630 [Thiosulfatimonas sediminis]
MPLAKQGLATAQSNIGLLYDLGKGVEQNYAEAIYWYEAAAQQGDINAEYNLAVMYFQGKGVPQNNLKAQQWFLQAAQQNHSNAQNNLGWIYEHGLGVPIDLTKAQNWYRKAAQQNNALAEKNLNKLAQKIALKAQQPSSEQAITFQDIAWFEQQPKQNFTLQLASAKSVTGLHKMLQQKNIENAKVFKQRRNQKINYIALLESKESRKDINELAQRITIDHGITPWIRTFANVNQYLDTPQN